MNNTIPTEAQEQATLFHWAQMRTGQYPELALLYHIPNGGYRKPSEAARFKAEGVKAGVPDLCLPVAKGIYHGLYIELKRQRNGKVSDNQTTWINALTEQGYAVCVAHGWVEAAEVLTRYIQKGEMQ